MRAATPDAAGQAERLSICFVSRALPVHRLGGLEYHLRDLARALSFRGHKVSILTTSGGAGEKFPDGVKVYEIPRTAGGDYNVAFFRSAGKAAKALCEKVKADVLCPVDLAGLFLRPKDYSAVVIPLIHGTLTSEVPLDWRFRRHLGLLMKLRNIWFYRNRIALLLAFSRMLNRVSRLVVDSEFTRRELMFEGMERCQGSAFKRGKAAAALAQKIFVVPLGLDKERYPAPLATGKRSEGDQLLKICLLGRLQQVKGIGQAIEAAAALKVRGVNFQMDIGGAGEFEAEARKRISALKLDHHVRLEGRIDPADLASWFHMHDLFLFPDITQPAFGLVALEAMMYGLPVVAARVGAVPEVVTDNCGWLYDPWDVNELAGLLMNLADNPAEIRQKASCARIRSEDFNADKMAEDIEKVFIQAVEGQQSR